MQSLNVGHPCRIRALLLMGELGGSAARAKCLKQLLTETKDDYSIATARRALGAQQIHSRQSRSVEPGLEE